MKPLVVTAFEHQTLSVGTGQDAVLRPDEAGRLLELGVSRPGFCVAGRGSVKLAQYAGLVNLGGRMLEVLPKVGEQADAAGSRGTFLRMLHLASDVRMFSAGTAGHDLEQRSLLGVFVSAFLGELVHLVRSGLLRRYQGRVGDLRVVRGRLDVARQAAVHGMRSDLLACAFDELVVDNPWNQVLCSALMAVKPWASDAAGERQWRELASAFDEVSSPPNALSLSQALVPDRQARPYAAAIRWAQLILRLLSPNVRAGRTDAPECLIDMNRLFESSVARTLWLGSRRRGLRVATQESGRFLARVAAPGNDPMFRLRPDLVIRDAEGVVAIGDTKWSLLKSDARGWLAPEAAHAYQMHAYASAFPCRDMYLVYPWHPGLDKARETSLRMTTVAGTSVSLHVVCLDITDDGFKPRSGGERWKRLYEQGHDSPSLPTASAIGVSPS